MPHLFDRQVRVAVLAATALALPSVAQCGIVADLTPGTANDNNIAALACAFGEELYFSNFSATLGGSKLWKWTALGGAAMVAPGSSHHDPHYITPCVTALGPRVFYSAFVIGQGYELHASDGTAAGTGLVKQIQSGSGSSLPFDFAASGGRVFFNARDSANGEELWVSDGTNAGTVRLSDFAPGSGNGRPNDMFDFDGKILFSAFDPATGRELFASDGTTAGTQLLLDIEPGVVGSGPSEFTRVGDFVYFVANTSSHGAEVWKTDGTAVGTTRLTDRFNSPAFGPVELTACGDQLFFHSITGSGYGDLYVSDGTIAGTVNLGVLAKNLVCSGNTLFFSGNDSATGHELWSSNGTVAGTQLVLDIVPGVNSSFPAKLVDTGAGICFVASSTVIGELWFSDGSTLGTTHVCTLDPGGNAGIDLLTMCRGRLFMNAYDPNYGRELIGIQTPGASATMLGVGGRPDYPTLRTAGGGAPILGTTVHLEGHGPAGAAAVLLAGVAGLPSPTPWLPGFLEGGDDWVGLLAGTAVTAATVLASSFSVPIALPNSVALEGQVFNFQTVWVHGTASPTLQASNAVQLALGAAAPH